MVSSCAQKRVLDRVGQARRGAAGAPPRPASRPARRRAPSASPVEHAARGAEQILEQLRLPAVPDLRAGAADVGDGEQVERDQAPLVADHVGEGAHHVRVVHVLLLRHRRHGRGGARPGTRPGRVSSRDRPCSAAEALRVRRCRASNGRRRGPWRCRGRAPRRTAASGARSRSSARLQSGNSCANSGMVKRRRLRSTIRMCWSTV